MKPYDFVAGGHRLRVSRLALGISEAECAAAAGVTVPTWRRWEAGGKPKGGGALDFAFAYDVCPNWICSGDAGNVGRHLREGKVAILPAFGPRHRRLVKEWQDKIAVARYILAGYEGRGK